MAASTVVVVVSVVVVVVVVVGHLHVASSKYNPESQDSHRKSLFIGQG